MLARALKPNCDGLHDVAKHFLTWAFNGNRKFSTGKRRISRFDENGDYFPSKRSRTSQFGQSNKFEFEDNLKKINWDGVTLKPFAKNFYTPHPDVVKRPAYELQEFLSQNEITVKGKNCPAPVFTLEEAGLSDKMINLVRNLNYTEPTPIQAQGWPIALSGRNMVGIARTGSGKTLGFVLPGIIHIQNQPKLDYGEGPIVLVIAPTRELVQQIQTVSYSLTKSLSLNTVAVYGGSERYGQAKSLKRGAEICIATPGRLLDFLKAGVTNLKRCTYLVLDEADRMFDMGFEPQIRSIIEQIRPDRQVLMWSATWPKEIRSLAEEYLDDYIQLKVGSLELMANPNIKQIVHVTDVQGKKQMLHNILEEITQEDEHKTLIFAATKQRADLISYWLNSEGFRSDSIHSNKTQRNREYILSRFRKGALSFLVATDVVARGLDVSDIKYVVNYDYPTNSEDYIHRIGRTGRHNNLGTSYTIITEEDASRVSDLITILKDANQEVNPDLLELAKFSPKYNRNRYNQGFRGYKRGFNRDRF